MSITDLLQDLVDPNRLIIFLKGVRNTLPETPAPWRIFTMGSSSLTVYLHEFLMPGP